MTKSSSKGSVSTRSSSFGNGLQNLEIIREENLMRTED